VVAVLGLALSSCYQDRSPKPEGEWRHVVDLTSSDVQFDIWETGSTRDNASCVDVTATPAPFYELPRDAPDLYKGREAACTFRPTHDDPVNWLWLAENGDNYGLVVAALPADTSATMTLVGGRQVTNAVTQDESADVNYFVGFLDRSERAASLELETPEGKLTCEFVDRKVDERYSVRDIDCPDGP
jgi:hypothetical protein